MKITKSPFTDGQSYSLLHQTQEPHAVLADESDQKC